jgi:hypothetical protein
MAAPGDNAGSEPGAEPGLWPLIRRHKRAAATAVTIVVVAIALTVVPGLVDSSSGPLKDSTTCTQWSAASSPQKAAYVQLYLDEYGTFSGAGATSTAVRTTIDHGCIRAGFLGEGDNASVLAAVRGEF